MNEVIETNKISKELNKIYRHLLRNDKKIMQMQKDLQGLHDLSNKQFKELNYANLLHDTIIDSAWLKDKSFSLHGWAANYSFIYMLYRILDAVRPMHIIEMGMGQTSKVTSQYIANYNPSATLDIIENDENWITVYSPQLAKNEHIKVHQCGLEFFIHDAIECRKYEKLSDIAKDTKYNLIIVDGPWGAEQTLPRSNILDLIENNNLSDDFIIIFDDAERIGEQNTVSHAIKLLREQNAECFVFQREGIKTQVYITSSTKSFIQYL